MSEFETDTIKPSSLGKKTVDASRRKLTAAMLAGPVVLSTLASKQALGQDFPYRCTVSGQISILNTDSVRPAGQPCNTFGQPPDWWKDRTNCWLVIDRCAPFNSIFGGTQSEPMGKLINARCAVGTDLERAAVASYLNAYHFTYPLSKEQVVELFQTASSAGLDVLTYFQSLYGGLGGPSLEGCVADHPLIQCDTWGGVCTAAATRTRER